MSVSIPQHATTKPVLSMSPATLAGRAISTSSSKWTRLRKRWDDGDPTVQAQALRRDHYQQDRLAAAQNDLRLSHHELAMHDEMRVHFLAMASHEFRTPLTSISGFASTLLTRWDELDDVQKISFVQIINEQSDRLTRLVTDILTLTKLEGGEFIVRPQSILICEPIDQALRAVGHDDIEIDCPEGTLAFADRDAIEQIIWNLVSNALKYGSEPIRVQVRMADQVVEVRVCDQGPGVPQEFRPHMFTKFAQAIQAGGPNPTGTGLGLAIVQALARAQGGDVHYEDVSTGGACFVVTVPAC